MAHILRMSLPLAGILWILSLVIQLMARVVPHLRDKGLFPAALMAVAAAGFLLLAGESLFFAAAALMPFLLLNMRARE